MQKSRYVFVAALLAIVLLAASPLAAQPTATFNLTGVGSGANLAGVYTSPYAGKINGGATIPVICDDFSDESFVPEQWTAYATSLSSLLSGTANTSVLKWQSPFLIGSGAAVAMLSQTEAYSAAALLAIDILTSTGIAQEEYSFAMWDLFDPGAFALLTSHGFVPYETVAQNFLNIAVNEASTGNMTSGSSVSSYLSNYTVTIYSYNGKGTWCGGGYCPPPPQEFITVSVAEPPSPALLGVDLLGLAGLVLFARRRGWLAREI